MSASDRELAQSWLRKAGNDLVSARQILLLPDGPTDTVCFHAQQAAEKSLKALLTAHQVRVPRTNSLLRLLDMALPFMPELASFREPLAEMSLYAVAGRYPAAWPDPPREEAVLAVEVAERMLPMVQAALRTHDSR